MWSKIKNTLEKYYRFLGSIAAVLGFLIWILEASFVKDSESKINSIQRFSIDLIAVHEFWDLKQKFQQQAIDQFRAYNRLGKILGGTEGLQKYDEELNRILLVNTIKQDAMVSAVNISELVKGVLDVLGDQNRLDSLTKYTVKNYNSYANEINSIKLEIKDLRNIPDSSIQKLDKIKSINIKYRDIFKVSGQEIINEAERIKESLEKKKKSMEFKIKAFNICIGTLFIAMSFSTILGSYFEARKK